VAPNQSPWGWVACLRALSLFFVLSCGLLGVPNGRMVVAIPVEMDLTVPGRERFGSITFVSGFELKSSDSRFGGLSGLVVEADGSKLYAVSDRGYWISASLHHDAAGRLTGFDDWEIAPLLNLEGASVSGRNRDAEGLTRDHDGSFIVCFEQHHRLWRYPLSPAPWRAAAQKLQTPEELAKAPTNGGLEAITVLPDGRLFTIAEEYENADRSLKAWLIEKDRFASLSYFSSDGSRPSDMAILANGDVVVLERGYSLLNGWTLRLLRISRDRLRADTQLRGEEIARLLPPLPQDNFEGLALREDSAGGTFLYLVSDDNYNPFQRTLLLQFRLE